MAVATSKTPIDPGAILRIKKLLEKETRKTLAVRLGVSEMSLSYWLTGKKQPSATAYLKLARLTQGDDRDWFLSKAGESEIVALARDSDSTARDRSLIRNKRGYKDIPLLRDSAAAGTPRAIDDSEVELMLQLPKDWFLPGSKLQAVRVAGDSMYPLIRSGFIVFVDMRSQSKESLCDRIVAARNEDGVTIKYLREDDGVYMLAPYETSETNRIQILKSEDGWEIVGEVVKWIGEPPKVK